MSQYSPTAWFSSGGLILTLVALEVIGRGFTSEFMDGAALLLITAWLTRPGCRMLLGPLRPVAATGWRTVRSWGVDLGIDFSGKTPIERGFPRPWLAVLGLTGAMAITLATLSTLAPINLRASLVPISYLAYLALIGLLWAALATGILIHGLLGWARLHDWMVVRNQRRLGPSMRHEWKLTCVLFGLTLQVAVLLPVKLALLVQLAMLATASLTSFACSSGLEVIWAFRTGSPPRSMDGRWVVLIQCALAILLSMALILVAHGGAVAAPMDWLADTDPRRTPIGVTYILGYLFAWFSVLGNLVFLNMTLRFAAQGLRFNPQRIQRQLQATHQDWTAGQRRDFEIQCRRELVRRLKTLFQHVARQKARRGGTGVVLALQHWYVWGLFWDSDEHRIDDDNTIFEEIAGPPFHLAFSRESRFHYWQMTQALKIDLIYVEHGVNFRRLVGVFRTMFEVYDMFGGRQRAEERHFTGLPKVRVILHDHDISFAPHHGREAYPEPKYHEISRARILHVFKDRGDESALDVVPETGDWVPVSSSW